MLKNSHDTVSSSVGPTGAGIPAAREKSRLQIAAEEPEKTGGCC